MTGNKYGVIQMNKHDIKSGIQSIMLGQYLENVLGTHFQKLHASYQLSGVVFAFVIL